MTLVETVEDVAMLEPADPDNLAFLTQTTLSVDDTAADRRRRCSCAFRRSASPRSEDICYATSNRQAAVKAIAPQCDRMLVIGAPNSSNSLRLAEVAERSGVPARLIQRATDIDWDWLGSPRRSASPPARRRPKSSSAKWSTPCASGSMCAEEIGEHAPERMTFKLPRELVA